MLTGLRELVTDWARDAHERAVDRVVADLHENAPVATGALVDSFHQEDREDSDGFSTKLGFSADYASYTDTGARPHSITPNNAPFLQFFWPDGPTGAHVYRFDEVDHPGQEGTNWFTDGMERYIDYLQEELR